MLERAVMLGRNGYELMRWIGDAVASGTVSFTRAQPLAHVRRKPEGSPKPGFELRVDDLLAASAAVDAEIDLARA